MSYFIKAPYTPKTNTVEHQRFSEEYFSGSDISIYFGDIWIDDITSMQFGVQENVQPVYGYASYIPDAWARGNRIINGSFTINFKENYYIASVLNLIEERRTRNKEFSPLPSTVNRSRQSIDEVLAQTKNIRSTNAFGRIANAYQRAIWGNPRQSTRDIRARMDNQKNDSYFTPMASNPLLNKNGFTIIISYGPSIEEKYRRERTLGQTAADSAVSSIIGVQLASATQVLGSNGQAIQEEYRFMATDLNYRIK